MKRFISILSCFIILLVLSSCSGTKPVSGGQSPEGSTSKETPPEPEIYRGAYTKLNDLVHTKLEIKPVFERKELDGKAWITLHPHFYATDSLTLNARGMELREVSLVKKNTRLPLKYEYKDDRIRIRLDTVYSKDDTYTVFIDYTSKPELLKEGGSAAIRKDKGLYFINADGQDPDKPKQCWTQGETESNSVWFPTIESPGQKMTQEIYIIVDTSFETLSNGLFLSTQVNNDGTRTDYWKQSLPAAPYLTMFATGDYAVVKDRWKNIEVSYYVDKPYEKYARMIFGHTPEMIEFFSTVLRTDFAWEKYAQVVVHDYVSGAMENTTAVVHGTNMQQDPRAYADGNYEDYISHELFHHWFGDLVTCESWANITLNEGFANYAEYLWQEHKSGRDEADIQNQAEQSGYIMTTGNADPPLIRYQYEDREDVYDAVSYNKGGRVLHMLRKYVGDEAFFSSLHNYLEEHRFSTGEIHELRLAFEKVTGEDLNWFFNQWYLKGGRPSLNIASTWDDNAKTETISLEQTQDFKRNPLFRLPMDVDFYFGNIKERHRIVLEKAKQEFVFKFPGKPDLVNVDAEKMLLLAKKKENKSNTELIFQYRHAPLYLDRYEAISKIGTDYRPNTPEAVLMRAALHDSCWKIRLTALDNIGELAKNETDSIREQLIELTTSDPKPVIRETALKTLNKNYKYANLAPIYDRAFHDSSYLVQSRAFKIIAEKDSAKAVVMAEQLETDSAGTIISALTGYYADHNVGDKNAFYGRALRKARGWNKYQIVKDYGRYLRNKQGDVFTTGTEQLFRYGKTNSSKNVRSSIIAEFKAMQSELKYRIQSKKDAVEEMKKETSKHPEITLEISDIKVLENQSDQLSEKITALDQINKDLDKDK